MSRTRNFPPVLWRGLKSDGQLVVMKDKCSPTEVLEFIKKEQITHIGKYILEGYMPKSRKRTPKPAPTPADIPPELDNRLAGKPDTLIPALTPEEGAPPRPKRHRRTKAEIAAAKACKDKPMFHCTACNRDVDNPLKAPNGKTQCPHCLAVGKIVGIIERYKNGKK